MNECIENIKSKLLSAIDLDQKKILRVQDVYEALKLLEVFPMTLDILNSSRIGKVVNDVRHFNETNDDIKNRLKYLIKEWNVKLFPQQNKKQQKPVKIRSNGCHKSLKVSESVNNIPHDNRGVHDEFQKSYHSSNNIKLLNGHCKNQKVDCDKSFEVPLKKAKYEHDLPRSKTLVTESPKSQQKENHFENKNISNSIAQINSLSSVDKTRKRKHGSASNGMVITPIQKVKSTVELLHDMGDLVGNDTKKKILCNEIILEDDIPRSCVPESYRPRMKPIKIPKSAQYIKPITKIVKTSPKVPNSTNEKLLDFHSPKSDIKEEQFIFNYNQKNCKSSPYIHNKDSSPSGVGVKSNKLKPIVNIENEKMSLKLKIAVKHKKTKHIDPPVTNRMDEIPILDPLDDNTILSFDKYIPKSDRGMTQLSHTVVDQLAHTCWDGYNMTRHPISGHNLSFIEMYIVNGLYVLPWTDTVYNSRVFFPDNTADELTRLSDSVNNSFS